MPIEVFTDIQRLTQSEFHTIEERVMRIVFDVHNEFGRTLDEAIYRQAIAMRCLPPDFASVEREVRMQVTYETFAKDYFADLLFNHGALLEAKTALALTPAHRMQTLTYLFLMELNHARLVNLRPERVEFEFVSTRLTHELRRRFTVIERSWQEVNPESAWLKAKLIGILRDWGAFLEISLYLEAITHLLGGPDKVLRLVEVFSGQTLIGLQPSHLLTSDTAFSFSAVTERPDLVREHHWKFLRHTRLRSIQWVNFNRDKIEFETLTRET